MKMTKRRLTRQEFEQAVRAVSELGDARIKKFSEEEQDKILQWVKTYTQLFNLCTLTRVEARMLILSSLAEDCVRIFLLELSISFYAHGGDTDDFEERLVNSIAAGLRIDGRNQEHCELPEEVLISSPLTNFPATGWSYFILVLKRMLRLTKEVTLTEYLISNRHMQMIVLLAFSDDIE